MNNKPVAYVDRIWMDRPDLVMSHQLEIGKLFARTQFTNYIPLYTHPADLADEEIYKIANEIEAIQPQHGLKLSNDLNVMNFARAILRKAQEK